TNNIHTDKPCIYVESSEPHRMIVIPQCGGALLVSIGVNLFFKKRYDVAKAACIPCFGIAVIFRPRFGTVQVGYGADFPLVGDIVYRLIPWENMSRWEIVISFPYDASSSFDVKELPRKLAVIAPKAGFR